MLIKYALILAGANVLHAVLATVLDSLSGTLDPQVKPLDFIEKCCKTHEYRHDA